ERAEGNEADLPEREHAGTADEDVDRDDDRDGRQRVQEVDLVGAGDERRTDPNDDDQQHRRGQRDPRVQASAHTRAPTAERPRANRPPGRSSRTTITSAKTADGRKTVLSVGRAPLITPVANPI